MSSTLTWLGGLDDERLVTLLTARPDLAVPAPNDLNTLAGRLNQSPSVWRAMERVSVFGIEILSALALLGAGTRTISREALLNWLPGVDAQATEAEIGRLQDLGLIRDVPNGFEMSSTAVQALGPYPAGLGSPGKLTAQAVAGAIATVSPPARGILETLAPGPPLGLLDPGGQVARLADELVKAGLLTKQDATHVELPREVGLYLRGNQPLGEVHAAEPNPSPSTPGVARVDSTAGTEALNVLRRLRSLLDAFAARPVPVLRSGGLGVRETRKLTKELGIDEPSMALFVELLAASGLLDTGRAGNTVDDVWAPTVNVDGWLSRTDEDAWALIVRQWLDLRRDPSRVGQPGLNDKTVNLLSYEASWQRGPADRRWVLGVLDELPPGSGRPPADVDAVLAWRSPLRDVARRQSLVTAVVREATTLGIVAYDSLSSAGRALLAGSEDLPAVLAASLPTPGRTILVQADLTVVAPGRLENDLAEALTVAADVESAGAATVYRVTAASIRRALDLGRGAAELHRLFADHSATPVPQALTYLIDDIARRHGVLRAGQSNSYLRCDDPLLIDQAIAAVAAAGIALRRIAPTVAVTGSDTEELLTELRKAGMVPVAEDEFGVMVTLGKKPRRVKAGLATHQRWREPAPPSRDQLAILVRRMRGTKGKGNVTLPAVDVVERIRAAARSRETVWIEYLNDEGAITRRLIDPVALSGGSVAAFDHLSVSLRTFALHRITDVTTEDQLT